MAGAAGQAAMPYLKTHMMEEEKGFLREMSSHHHLTGTMACRRTHLHTHAPISVVF